MELLEEIVWTVGAREHRIELLSGDLSSIPAEYAVDALVVSAFPESYVPRPNTLIASLHHRGIEVADLAADKDQDLRQTASCWLSKPIGADLGFRRIVCFEPPWDVSAAEAVSDLFRGLVPLSSGEPWIRTVATSLLASGQQGEPQETMLRSIVEAAHHWISSGAEIEELRIVLFHRMADETREELRSVFRATAKEIEAAGPMPMMSGDHDRKYDLFVSYSRKDRLAADQLVDELVRIHPDIRIFRDLEELDSGSAWQREIYEAIDDSRYFVCLYSPGYLASKVCVDELHIGMIRHRNEGGDVLIPAYLRSASLPSYLQAVQYRDVREHDERLLVDFAEDLVQKVRNREGGLRRLAVSESRSESGATRGERSTTRSTTIGVEDLSVMLGKLAADGEVRLDVTIRLAKGCQPDH